MELTLPQQTLAILEDCQLTGFIARCGGESPWRTPLKLDRSSNAPRLVQPTAVDVGPNCGRRRPPLRAIGSEMGVVAYLIPVHLRFGRVAVKKIRLRVGELLRSPSCRLSVANVVFSLPLRLVRIHARSPIMVKSRKRSRLDQERKLETIKLLPMTRVKANTIVGVDVWFISAA